METVAFFGLGQMGQGMALRLLEHGYSLGVYNRTREKAAAAVEKGAELFDTPATAVGAAELLITMLSDDNAVTELVSEEVLHALGPGSIHLSMSSISPAASQDLLSSHAAHGVQYLACPVFGRPDAARAGKLWLCLAGEEEAKSRVHPLLEVLGQGVFDFGNQPPAATVVKLAGNFLIASAIEAMAEAFSFVEKNGADPNQAHALLTQTLFACPIYQNYGKFILDQSYDPPGFNLTLGFKDIRLVRDTARKSELPMPLAGLLEDRFLRSLANGRGSMDWTAIAIDQRESAGLTDN
jgi:3-hydroxyisobutyrate dehydrogenase-like beta-hydroxyacid dehydrogenase